MVEAGLEVSEQLSGHLSRDEIARYVDRRAGVDELLEAAQHLEDCSDCRDRAAELVESRESDGSHPRWVARLAQDPEPEHKRESALFWLIGVVVIVVLAALFLFNR